LDRPGCKTQVYIIRKGREKVHIRRGELEAQDDPNGNRAVGRSQEKAAAEAIREANAGIGLSNRKKRHLKNQKNAILSSLIWKIQTDLRKKPGGMWFDLSPASEKN